MSKPIRKTIFGLEIEAHPIVFPISAALIVLFVVIAAALPQHTFIIFSAMQAWITDYFGWLYILGMTGFLVFAVFLGFSRFGKIRLGPDNERPEFPTITWFAMLFSAGMGIGMLFWGVAEPIYHFQAPPFSEGGTIEASRDAMGITLFHWCLHPWALYALVALSLAYFGFRRGLPLSFRSVFYPFLGDRIHGRMGDVIDVLAVLATLFGLATSLGLGAKQVNAGLNFVFGLEQSTGMQVVIIACITCAAVASLVSGLDVGIRRLSELNMGLAASLLLFLVIAGPTIYLFKSLFVNVYEYAKILPYHSFWVAGENKSWLDGWTIFYWGWWIAWSPFVGMFIARISKGRTIKEFITGTLLVPTGVAIIWLTVFGNSAIHQELFPQLESEEKTTELAEGAYHPHTEEVQVVDGDSGLPMTPDGELVGADNKKVANPTYLLLSATDDETAKGQPLFETASGHEVFYGPYGVLRDQETNGPFEAGDGVRYDGPFKAEEQAISLGEFISKPVLTTDRTTTLDSTATAMFFMLEAYPLAMLTAMIGTISVILFFITSSDSASLVADIIASGGSEDPTTGTRIFWGVLEGCLASVLLVAGGLKALQTGSITIALPFTFVIIGMCVCLYVGLRREVRGDIPDDQKEHTKFGSSGEETAGGATSDEEREREGSS